jgi:hypothetical protein
LYISQTLEDPAMPDFYSQLVGCEPRLSYHAPRGGEFNP